MIEQACSKTYPVFVMCGEDPRRRKMMAVLDPEGKYKSKALLPFLGRRLIDWQLEELRRSPYAADLYLIGLGAEDAAFDFPVHYVPVASNAPFADKLAAGLDYLEVQGENPDLIVISSCDTPGIRTAEINAFFEALAACGGVEFAISLVPEDVIEAEFPGSGRVVARFRDGPVIPGELYALSPRAIRVGGEVIRELSQRRRQIDRQKRKIGMGPILRFVARRPRTWGLLAKYALGTATLADAERGFGAAFGCPTRGVIISDAGFGMDMDLPEDYARLEAFVRRTKLGDRVD